MNQKNIWLKLRKRFFNRGQKVFEFCTFLPTDRLSRGFGTTKAPPLASPWSKLFSRDQKCSCQCFQELYLETRLNKNASNYVPWFMPPCCPCCACRALIDGLLLFCKCPNSGANNESSADDPPAFLDWLPANDPVAEYFGVDPTGFIPIDPEFRPDNPDVPEFIPYIDNPDIPGFIPDIPV